MSPAAFGVPGDRVEIRSVNPPAVYMLGSYAAGSVYLWRASAAGAFVTSEGSYAIAELNTPALMRSPTGLSAYSVLGTDSSGIVVVDVSGAAEYNQAVAGVYSLPLYHATDQKVYWMEASIVTTSSVQVVLKSANPNLTSAATVATDSVNAGIGTLNSVSVLGAVLTRTLALISINAVGPESFSWCNFWFELDGGSSDTAAGVSDVLEDVGASDDYSDGAAYEKNTTLFKIDSPADASSFLYTAQLAGAYSMNNHFTISIDGTNVMTLSEGFLPGQTSAERAIVTMDTSGASLGAVAVEQSDIATEAGFGVWL